MIKFVLATLVAIATLIGASQVPVAQQVAAIATDQPRSAAIAAKQPYGACTSKINSVTEGGGAVSRVTGATRNEFGDTYMGESKLAMALVFEFEYGYISSLYLSLEILAMHERIANTGNRMWFLIGDRGALPDVRNGKEGYVRTVVDESSEPFRYTSWFSGFAFINDKGDCTAFTEDTAVFAEDEDPRLKEMWSMVVSSVLLHGQSEDE